MYWLKLVVKGEEMVGKKRDAMGNKCLTRKKAS
jgi:hypothetical protein